MANYSAIIDMMLPSAEEREVLVLYGSQTGCAKDVARRIGRELRRHHFIPNVMPMDSIDISHLPTTQRAAFVCSTTGQGETPDNMKRFWRFLRRADLPPDSLQALRYSTFGLGDSNYPIYNAVARRLHERLRMLGATPILHRGLGDDQHPMGHDGALGEWLPAFTQALKATYPDHVTQWPEPIADLFSAPMYHTCVLRFPGTTQDESSMGTSNTNKLHALRAKLAEVFETSDAMFGTTIPALVTPAQPENPDDTKQNPTAVGLESASAVEYARSHDPGLTWTLANVPACAPLASTPGERLFAAPLAASHMIVHPSHAAKQCVRHLIFDLRQMPNQTLAHTYKPGAVLSVCAPQPTAAVREGLARLGLHPLDIVIVAPASVSSQLNEQAIDLMNAQLYEEYADQLLAAHCDPLKHPSSFPEYPASWPTPYTLLSLLNPDDTVALEQVSKFADQTPTLQVSFDTELPPVLFAYELVSRYLDFSGRTSRTILPYLGQAAQRAAELLQALYQDLQEKPSTSLSEDEHNALKEAISSAEYESERLSDFQTPVWATEWERYCVREGRSFLELMTDFPSAKLPLNWMIELVPRPSPRQFSIASSSLYQSSPLACSEPPTYISSTTDPNESVHTADKYNSLPEGCPQAHVCLAQVRYTTPYKRMKLGLCSTYLASLSAVVTSDTRSSPSPFIWASIRDPTFKYPVDPSIPLVMVGPGTGIAVFHAIAEHRAYQLQMPTVNVKPPLNWVPRISQTREGTHGHDTDSKTEAPPICLGHARLFFGCRYSQQGDWYYADFFHRCVDEIGALTAYDALFSRDHLRNATTVEAGTANSTPIDRYVQHRMVRDSKVAYDIFQILFENKGIFIVSGNAKQMPSDVKKALVAIVEACYPTPSDPSSPLPTQVPPTGSIGEIQRGITEEQATQLVLQLIDEGRYIQECWG